MRSIKSEISKITTNKARLNAAHFRREKMLKITSYTPADERVYDAYGSVFYDAWKITLTSDQDVNFTNLFFVNKGELAIKAGETVDFFTAEAMSPDEIVWRLQQRGFDVDGYSPLTRTATAVYFNIKWVGMDKYGNGGVSQKTTIKTVDVTDSIGRKSIEDQTARKHAAIDENHGYQYEIVVSYEQENEIVVNLTQHNATKEQQAQGIVDVSDVQELRYALTFVGMPTQESIANHAAVIVQIAKANGAKKAMIGGAPYLMSELERQLMNAKIVPCYAVSDRVTIEESLPDSSVKKTSVFKHLGLYEEEN